MILKELTGDYFCCNGNYMPSGDFDPAYLKKGKSVYEVLRVISGKPLFLPDHLGRFKQSLSAISNSNILESANFGNMIKALVDKNNMPSGNIKMVVNIHEDASLYIYFVPHTYPVKKDYETGVKMISCYMERNQPGVKAVNLPLREKTETLLADRTIYEILLVDHDGAVTEGSKSNVFFIKNNTLFTAPANRVLQGITRKYVMQICEKLNIKTVEKMIPYNDIKYFEAAFISGTSPKVLPVNTIDQIQYTVNHKVSTKIMEEYEKIIELCL